MLPYATATPVNKYAIRVKFHVCFTRTNRTLPKSFYIKKSHSYQEFWRQPNSLLFVHSTAFTRAVLSWSHRNSPKISVAFLSCQRSLIRRLLDYVNSRAYVRPYLRLRTHVVATRHTLDKEYFGETSFESKKRYAEMPGVVMEYANSITPTKFETFFWYPWWEVTIRYCHTRQRKATIFSNKPCTRTIGYKTRGGNNQRVGKYNQGSHCRRRGVLFANSHHLVKFFPKRLG